MKQREDRGLRIEDGKEAVRGIPLLMCGEMVVATLADLKEQTRRVVKPQPSEGDEFDAKCLMYSPIKIDRRGQQYPGEEVFGFAGPDVGWVCPYGKPGDRIWVRETYAKHPEFPGFIYRADRGGDYQGAAQGHFKWKPSIFMKREASRITLEVVSVRVERVQDIIAEDVLAEGIRLPVHEGKRIERITGKFIPADYLKRQNVPKSSLLLSVWLVAHYAALWDSLNMKPKLVGKKGGEFYQCFPWSNEMFDKTYPGVRTSGVFRGKKMVVTANPWVWVVTFKKVTPNSPSKIDTSPLTPLPARGGEGNQKGKR